MVFEYAVDLRSDRNRPHRITEQIAYHTHTISMRDFY